MNEPRPAARAVALQPQATMQSYVAAVSAAACGAAVASTCVAAAKDGGKRARRPSLLPPLTATAPPATLSTTSSADNGLRLRQKRPTVVALVPMKARYPSTASVIIPATRAQNLRASWQSTVRIASAVSSHT